MRAWTLLILVACGGGEGEAPKSHSAIERLAAREQLIRLSVDTRGIHPDATELAVIEESPENYEAFVDRYLQDPRFLGRMRDIFNQRYLTRTGDTYFSPSEAGIRGDSTEVAASLADEPLMLVSHIIEHDLPWTELVTADYTMANPTVAAMWDIEYPDNVVGWQQGHYRDGRPHAGILSMTTLWQRYPSMGGNANRHRANAVSRLLLCDDYLTRPIVLNRAAVDQLTVDPEDAINTNDTCQSCHSTLDPLSAHFFGFFRVDDEEGLREATLYRPENEQDWTEYSGREPGYFGHPTKGLAELGQLIAEDPRFRQCAVRTMVEGLTQRQIGSEDWKELQDYVQVFEDNGLVVRPVVKSILMSDVYRAGRITDPDLAMRVPTVRTVSPTQMASIIEDITQYRWTFGGVDGMVAPAYGLGVLGGGIDGKFVTVPSYDPGVGSAFLQERLAQAAAWEVVTHDLDPGRVEGARLLAYVTIEDRPETSRAAFDQQIRYLYERASGLPLGEKAPEVDEMISLWKEIYELEGSVEKSWAAVLSVILRDPHILFY